MSCKTIYKELTVRTSTASLLTWKIYIAYVSCCGSALICKAKQLYNLAQEI